MFHRFHLLLNESCLWLAMIEKNMAGNRLKAMGDFHCYTALLVIRAGWVTVNHAPGGCRKVSHSAAPVLFWVKSFCICVLLGGLREGLSASPG